jgi:hypothetical protein
MRCFSIGRSLNTSMAAHQGGGGKTQLVGNLDGEHPISFLTRDLGTVRVKTKR